MNLSEWAALLGVSRDTVASYLEILESSHVLAILRPFAGGRRSELTRSQRVYFVDNGIRHHLVGDLRPLRERGDAGPALENWAFTEIWKALPSGAEPRFWRTTSQAEVDFVVESGGALVAVEARATDLGRPALGRSARSFIEAYAPQEFLVVNRGVDTRQDVGRTTVRWIRPEHLASSLDRALR